MEKIVLPQELGALMIQHRHHLHAHPELSFQEKETAAYIKDCLHEYGIPFTQIEGYHSVIGRLQGRRPGKTIAIRADMDALPMEEQNDVPYRSTVPNVMHACGHDAHTAVLLGLAKLFAENRDKVAGQVVFIFQHGEEKLPGGAVTLVEQGVLDDVDVVLGGHVFTPLPLGTVCYNEDALTASADIFEITLTGKGGHAAQPHLCNDVLLAGTTLTQQLQTIISRDIDPMASAVLTVSQLHAGVDFNVLPDRCTLGGTVRTLDEGARAVIERRMREITAALCQAQGLAYELKYEKGYPVMNCDAHQVLKAAEAIRQQTGCTVTKMKPSMGGEDFAYYSHRVPSAFFFVGCRNEEKGIVNAHHSPNFDIDEQVIPLMAEVLLAAYRSAAEAE